MPEAKNPIATDSQPGVSYRVTDGAGGWGGCCTCYRYRRDCRHVQALRAVERAVGPVETPRLAEARARAMAMLMGR